MKVSVLVALACLAGVGAAPLPSAAPAVAPYGARQGKLRPTKLLRSYQGFVNDFVRSNDAYKLEYHVGDSSRFEQRTASGEVTGAYAFVAPEGDEYEFKYEAGTGGYRVEGDALPQVPEDTDDVKAARDAFFEAYEKQLELTKDYDYEEDSDESDEESSEESSEEDSDEESDEESDESSEEDSEESDEDDEDEDEEEEEEDLTEVAPSAPKDVSTAVVAPAPKDVSTAVVAPAPKYESRPAPKVPSTPRYVTHKPKSRKPSSKTSKPPSQNILTSFFTIPSLRRKY